MHSLLTGPSGSLGGDTLNAGTGDEFDREFIISFLVFGSRGFRYLVLYL